MQTIDDPWFDWVQKQYKQGRLGIIDIQRNKMAATLRPLEAATYKKYGFNQADLQALGKKASRLILSGHK